MITFNESLDEALQSISAAPDLMSMLDNVEHAIPEELMDKFLENKADIQHNLSIIATFYPSLKDDTNEILSALTSVASLSESMAGESYENIQRARAGVLRGLQNIFDLIPRDNEALRVNVRRIRDHFNRVISKTIFKHPGGER
jgi:DNA-directed RNA polymerase subunit F